MLAIFDDAFVVIAVAICFVTLVIFIATKILPKFVKNQRILKLTLFLDRKILWNGILRYTITAYLKLAKIAISSMRSFENDTGTSICLKVVFFIFICIFPMQILGFLQERIS